MYRVVWEFVFLTDKRKRKVILKAFVGSDPQDAAMKASEFIDGKEYLGWTLTSRIIKTKGA